jgi:hypothetical protein
LTQSDSRAIDVPNPELRSSKLNTLGRVVRIFVSSTFEDMKPEREVISTQVMPELRRRARRLDAEIVSVDLRWGVPPEEAVRGGTIRACLREVSRCDFFIGLLGTRYGWVPAERDVRPDVLREFPWLRTCIGALSMTHLEFRQWLLAETGRAERLLCFRRHIAAPIPEIAQGDSKESLPGVSGLQNEVERHGIRIDEYDVPDSLAALVVQRTWELVSAHLRNGADRTALKSEASDHSSYAMVLCRNFVGREPELDSMARSLAKKQVVIVSGRHGMGKSATIAEFLRRHRQRRPGDEIVAHFADRSGTDSSSQLQTALLARLEAAGARRRGDANSAEVARSSIAESMMEVSHRFASSSKQLIIAIDCNANPNMLPLHELLPHSLPRWVRIVLSVSDDPQTEFGESLGREMGTNCTCIQLGNMSPAQAVVMVKEKLAEVGRSLGERRLRRFIAHPRSGEPAFVRAVLHEISSISSYRGLSHRLNRCLQCDSTDSLMQRTVESLERMFGRRAVRRTLAAILASGEGMTEHEIIEFSQLPPARWFRIRDAANDWLHFKDELVQIRNLAICRAIGARHFRTLRCFTSLCVEMAYWWLRRPMDPRVAGALHFQACSCQDRLLLLRVLADRHAGPHMIESVPLERQRSAWLAVGEHLAPQRPREFAVEVLDGLLLGWRVSAANAHESKGALPPRINPARSDALRAILESEHPNP